jgi:hypothetical protein
MPITIAGTGTITGLSAGGLPDGCITTDDLAAGAATPAKLSQPLTLATAQATTSGTSIDFTGIPSWVKRITVMFNGVSTNGSSNLQLQIGAGSVDTSGYLCGTAANGSSANFTTGVGVSAGGEATTTIRHGSVTLSTFGSNIWVAQGVIGRSDSAQACMTGASKSLSGTLDRLRLTTVNGTDTFDAGSVNIMYE